MKAVVALLVVAGCTYLIFHLSQGYKPGEWDPDGKNRSWEDPKPRPQAITFKSSKDCQQCHPEVYEEWMESHHRMAYTNPDVQLLSKGFKGEGLDCLPCHLSRPIPETGFGVRPLERAVRHEEGVDCMTCHHHPKSHVMLAKGPLSPAADQAPCQPEVHPALVSMDLCAPCHNQHKVHEEWRQSRFGPDGTEPKDCNGCHMPEVERQGASGEVRRGRSHRFPAAHDSEMLRSAASFSVESLGDREVLISITNDGAGHNFPTDERHRAVDLELDAQGGASPLQRARIFRFRNPYRQDFESVNPLPELDSKAPLELSIGPLGVVTGEIARIAPRFNPQRKIWYEKSTQIAAGESRSIRLKFPEGISSVTFRLWYRLKPETTNQDVLLHEKTLEL